MLAILALLAVLAARVDAAPYVPLSDPPPDSDSEPDSIPDSDPDPDPVPEAVPVLVPVSASALARVPGPPITAVLAAAYRAAGLDHDPTPSWRYRARLAGLVPTVSLRDGRDATWSDVADPTIGYISVFAVSASWRLDRLVFDPNELRISAIGAARRRERRRLAEAVIRTYFSWQRAVALADARAAEAAADLDAITDGWFSEAIGKHAETR
ncbi:MAG TPA: hypothetical protein VGF94_10835 [Kofleriaceae bacterium]